MYKHSPESRCTLEKRESPMFERKAYADLLRWHEQDRSTALLVTGARQIGKSTLVRHLGHTQYELLVEVNLFEDSAARDALAAARDAQDLITRLSLLADEPLREGRSLIFIDEIQELPDIATMAKFLVEDGRFRYAFSGSLLGTELRQVRSYPVGSVTEVPMFPMDFEEFCWALGVSRDSLDVVRQACAELTPVPDYLHEAFLNYFRTYVVVGGMPEAVSRFAATQGDLAAVRAFQHQLVTSYKHDIMKYAGNRALNVESIFEQLPMQLDKATRRFVLNSIDDDARYERYQRDFVWLTSAGVALKCDLVSDPKSPLAATKRSGSFKLYESDTGMLVSRYPKSLASAIYFDDRKANLGAAFENVMAQELTAMGLPLFYYLNRKRGEVDFLTEGKAGEVVPIEVKSGTSARAHAALDRLLVSDEYAIPRGIVLSRLNVEAQGKVAYLPWYAIFCLDEVLQPEGELPHVQLPRI